MRHRWGRERRRPRRPPPLGWYRGRRRHHPCLPRRRICGTGGSTEEGGRDCARWTKRKKAHAKVGLPGLIGSALPGKGLAKLPRLEVRKGSCLIVSYPRPPCRTRPVIHQPGAQATRSAVSGSFTGWVRGLGRGCVCRFFGPGRFPYPGQGLVGIAHRMPHGFWG